MSDIMLSYVTYTCFLVLRFISVSLNTSVTGPHFRESLDLPMHSVFLKSFVIFLVLILYCPLINCPIVLSSYSLPCHICRFAHIFLLSYSFGLSFLLVRYPLVLSSSRPLILSSYCLTSPFYSLVLNMLYFYLPIGHQLVPAFHCFSPETILTIVSSLVYCHLFFIVLSFS